MKSRIIAISLLLILCLSAVCCGADSRIKSLKLNDAYYQDGEVREVFQGETLKMVFNLDKSAEDYNYTLSFDKGKISLLNQSSSGLRRTIYFKVSESAKAGASDISINLIGTQSDKVLGDQNIRLKISESYGINGIEILSPRGGENDSTRVYFLADSGLSKDEEEAIDLEYRWIIYNEQEKKVATITGNGKYHSLSDGLYHCKLSVSDKTGGSWNEEFDFSVGNVKFTYKKTDIDFSKTKNTAIVGESLILDLTGTYCDGNCTIDISDDKGWTGTAYYYVPGYGKRSVLKLERKVDKPGVYTFTAEIKKFAKEQTLDKETFSVQVYAEGATPVIISSQNPDGSDSTSSSGVQTYSPADDERRNWSEKKIKEFEENKETPGFDLFSAMIAAICMFFVVRRAKK